mmetsp:Transcript_8133/g.24290  ORF Transcript_8133/g.24290 Transcript_8133/m.24290 type:complete len:213 (+) Transcript_8133:832-1470(+)
MKVPSESRDLESVGRYGVLVVGEVDAVQGVGDLKRHDEGTGGEEPHSEYDLCRTQVGDVGHDRHEPAGFDLFGLGHGELEDCDLTRGVAERNPLAAPLIRMIGPRDAFPGEVNDVALHNLLALLVLDAPVVGMIFVRTARRLLAGGGGDAEVAVLLVERETVERVPRRRPRADALGGRPVRRQLEGEEEGRILVGPEGPRTTDATVKPPPQH